MRHGWRRDSECNPQGPVNSQAWMEEGLRVIPLTTELLISGRFNEEGNIAFSHITPDNSTKLQWIVPIQWSHRWP